MIVDSHFHLGSCRVFGRSVSAGTVLETLDEFDIGICILQPFPGAPDPAVVHDQIADLAAETRGRVVGLASVNPHRDRGEYVREVERCVEDLGFVGVKLHTLGHAVHPMSDDAAMVFETAADLGIAVMIHTGPGMPFADPAHIVARASQFPDLPMVLAHAGASSSPATAIAVARQCHNVFLEPSWCRASEVRAMIDALGPERVMFGTDTPENVQIEFTKYEGIGLDDTERGAVFRQTAAKVFRLEGLLARSTEGGG